MLSKITTPASDPTMLLYGNLYCRIVSTKDLYTLEKSGLDLRCQIAAAVHCL
jgi:hypothetical protein